MTQRTLSLPGKRSADLSRLPIGPVLDDPAIGRIEEWVVSAMDDRAKAPEEADWLTSLDGLNLTKRGSSNQGP